MSKDLPSLYQSIIHLTRYSRYLGDWKRRETWEETVGRLMDFLITKQPSLLKVAVELEEAILNLEVMPSMRLLMTAGVAAERDNVAAYNCAYEEMNGEGSKIKVLTPEMERLGFDEAITINVASPINFDEGMYILLCGTGLGFSVERQGIASLPVVGQKCARTIYQRTQKNFPGVPKDELSIFNRKQNQIVVTDSKYGWASALRILITELYNGNFTIGWDTSQVRPAGSPLKTFGGRASGPEPLVELFSYCVDLFKKHNGEQLNSLAVHDLTCKIASVVVVGGVRRAALISLSNLTDDRMRHAKDNLYVLDPGTGEWNSSEPQRAISNNSVAYTEKPDIDAYMREMTALIASKSGERGIYNRVAAQKQASRWGRRDASLAYGTNPCSEIILRHKQFCNLSEIILRSDDTYEDIKRKVRLATILGTIQATLTDFKYLSPEWKKNTEEERLLGVSFTGIMDNHLLNGSGDVDDIYILKKNLEELRDHARETNEEWANVLNIPVSAAITCVKPSGTVSQLVDSASGIHARHSQYYRRRITTDKKDTMYKFLKSRGVICEDKIGDEFSALFSFPVKAPEGAVCRNDRGAIEQLNLWLIYQRHWCEHKPSATISVKDEEWPDVVAWVYKHFDEVSGIAFLPFSDHQYQQAPYEDLTEEEYTTMVAATPQTIDFTKMIENRDNTEGTQTLACAAGGCEIS